MRDSERALIEGCLANRIQSKELNRRKNSKVFFFLPFIEGIEFLLPDASPKESIQRAGVQLSERLASLGEMGAQLMAPLKPPLITALCYTGVQGALN